MKKVIATMGALLLSASVASGAFASTGYYGKPQANLKNAAHFSQVTLNNYTHDGYMAYANFRPTGKEVDLHLGRVGSGTDVITYDISDTDYEVCLDVVRDFDGATVFSDCLSSGNVNIGPYMNANKPTVNVVK